MRKWEKAVIIALALAVFSSLGWSEDRDKNIDPAVYLSPPASYSRIGKSLVIRYEGALKELALKINEQIPSERFELFTSDQAPMGGVGFWINPGLFIPEARFLGVCARVNIKLTYFPDTQWGRLNDALDAFGKDLLRIMGEELKMIPDGAVKGVVLVLIYSKAELSDPHYYEQAEATVIFIPREVLEKFNNFQLTYAKLFDRSVMYYFQGARQIEVLLNEFIRG